MNKNFSAHDEMHLCILFITLEQAIVLTLS